GISNVFAQDDISIARPFRLTLGSKFEHDPVSGWNVQPTAKVMWNLGRAEQHVWAATARALRTPAPYDLGVQARVPLPPASDGTPLVFALSGNPGYKPERLTDIEAGYRVAIGPQATIDVTGFKGYYDGLPSWHPLEPRFELTPAPGHLLVSSRLSNGVSASTSGVEIVERWKPFADFRIDGSYSHLRIATRIDPATGDMPILDFQ